MGQDKKPEQCCLNLVGFQVMSRRSHKKADKNADVQENPSYQSPEVYRGVFGGGFNGLYLGCSPSAWGVATGGLAAGQAAL